MANTTPNFRSRRVNPAPSAPAPSEIGGYRLLRRLGSGGMSDVYLAYDPERGPIAIKVLRSELAKVPSHVERFQREATVGRLLDHPNIVRCFESARDAVTGQHYLVMEYVKGENAQAIIDRRGPMPVADAVRIVMDIAHGLEELHHRKYVHRDVKPGNIMVGEDGRSRLADLGVAKNWDGAGDLTSIDQGIGTPIYMPWEQTLNASLVDARSDLFSLGATFYYLVTGRVPFPGSTVQEVAQLKDEGRFTPIRKVNPELPAVLETIIHKMMARMPADRFQSATALLDMLRVSNLVQDDSPALPGADVDDVPEVTKPDLNYGSTKPPPRRTGEPRPWAVQFRRPNGSWKRIRGSAESIRRMYEAGNLPRDMYVGKAEAPRLRHFKSVPEFADLVHPTDRVAADVPTEVITRRKKKDHLDNLLSWGILGATSLLLTVTASWFIHLVCLPN